MTTNPENNIIHNNGSKLIAADANSKGSPLMYIIVIGFHHKKGCQVEFVYPADNRIQKINKTENTATQSSDLYKLPKNWRHLPSLALPDGSHNYDSDYIFFHLEDEQSETKESPSLNQNENDENTNLAKLNKTPLKPNPTIFGISCYRQINASEVLNKDSDVTRNTLQKSVCILSKMPLYSNIRYKLVSITSAYFEQKDFTKTELLINAFNALSQSYNKIIPSLISSPPPNINNILLDLNNEKSSYLVGLSLSDLVIRYQHKILVLFKLLLLQKKCLFQLNPVSNLSNTIMSLVSLIPDIFLTANNKMPEQRVTGLKHCSGFFDSIDLVNCELERKTLQKKSTCQDSSSNEFMLFTSDSLTQTEPVLNNHHRHRYRNSVESKKKSKSKKPKVLSFSKNKNSGNQNAPLSTLTSSFSSVSIKTTNSTSFQQQQNHQKALDESLENETSNNNHSRKISASTMNISNVNSGKKDSNRLSFFNVLSTNTQKLFSLNTNNNLEVSNSQHDESINGMIEDDYHDSSSSSPFKKAKLDIKTNVLALSRSSSSINQQLTEENNEKQQQNTHENSNVNGNSNGNQFGSLIKSRISNVFKMVDWTSNSNTPQQAQPITDTTFSTPISATSSKQNKKKKLREQLLKSSQHTNNNLLLDASLSSSNDLENQNALIGKNYDLEISELLDLDFGMPINLFNEFNILHPYLSLYYLEYFSVINKMNTKLYCTTALMMSMMKDKTNQQQNSSTVLEEQLPPVVDHQSQLPPLQPSSSPIYFPSSKANSPTSFGYSIGATNILFKQRLYDDLDAFIDETEIDLKNNDQLKKQLQLTTADLRFIDYIIKHVNAANKISNNEQQTQNNMNGNKSQVNIAAVPTLLSFKKTSSNNNIEKSPINTKTYNEENNKQKNQQQAMNWEGSDDWIRLNFKWYLYSLFGSIVKEELYTLIYKELDHIYCTTEAANSNMNYSNSSSNSSTVSLENEVIDIDEYIEKVNSCADLNDHSINSIENNISNSKTSNGTNGKNQDRKSSNSSAASATSVMSSSKYHYLMQSQNNGGVGNTHMHSSDYRDDFNSQYVSELKKTQFFKEWYEINKTKIEKALLKFDREKLELKLKAEMTNNHKKVYPATDTNDLITGGLNKSASATDLANLNFKFQLLLNQMQELDKIKLSHPFNGQIGVNDIKLRLNVLFTTTESGRKLNKALIEGGKLVNNTGKAMGEALSQAKSTLNSFLSNWSTSSSANSSPLPSSISTNSLSKNTKSSNNNNTINSSSNLSFI